jgi:four helix bundle protein
MFKALIMDYRDLKVYQKAFELAINIHNETKSFPEDEKYSLTTQIRRSSRSVCSNLAEGYRKRRYRNYFISKLVDADSENTETMLWIEFSKEFNYIDHEIFIKWETNCQEVGALLGYMLKYPEKFS